MSQRIFNALGLMALFVIAICLPPAYNLRADAIQARKENAIAHYELRVIAARVDSAERVIYAQEQFFERFLAGHWQYSPALESCRASFKRYTMLSSTYYSNEYLKYGAAQIDSLTARK